MSSTTNSSKFPEWLAIGFLSILGLFLALYYVGAFETVATHVGTVSHSAAFLAEKVGYSSAFLFVVDVIAQRWIELLISLLVIKASFELVTQYCAVRKYNRTYNKNKPKDEHSVLRTDFQRALVYLQAAALLSVVYFVFHQYPTG